MKAKAVLPTVVAMLGLCAVAPAAMATYHKVYLPKIRAL